MDFFCDFITKKMKTMKKMKLLFMVLLVSGFVYAQEDRPQRLQGEKPSPEEMIQKGIDRMKENLELSENQTAEIKRLLEKHHEEMQTEREAFRNMMEAHREKMQEKRGQLNEEIKSSLNDEQKVKFEEMNKRRKERIKKEFKERRDDRIRHRAPRP